MEGTVNQQIHKCKAFINFMLTQQQWSGITKAEIDQWVNNFKGLNPNELLLVYKLLANLIYYSENDVIDALREGVYNCLFYNILLDKQKSAKFGFSAHALSSVLKDELKKTCFIPLLDSDSPHESANYLARLLVQQQLVDAHQSMFLDDAVGPIETGRYSRLVIIDDCIGSGDQLRGFWNDTAKLSIDGIEISLDEFCKLNSVDISYLTLFGYDKSIDQLKREIPQLNICCVRMLSDSQRVFFENSYIWTNEEERHQAQTLFSELTKEHGIPLFGHGDLDFAFIMHKTIPDWSLPMFWKERPDWKLLMRRKNSSA
ncbi:hypothetical protein Desde_3998 [Desulfitobacterium dehalogenans ATCC 51507]|uniref:PRTase-CE domain-containing protein n=1 Tax=Desulfitobacterium dehalogenans (strain ATCC 51507 / DSM 9161 / JW/IU-DC1) TaxID=756499 RepID=I4AE75_DESDJ|nr:hypothetical protein [Desulfitobacterium dehalogenans]AFM02260.1 hypothetical protein Desde_3998 [Desulfitobacterium dehalogenans ATCC 51507]